MINLQKGQKIQLDKGIQYGLVGLGWDTNRYDGGYEFDLDASVFLLGAGDKLLRDEDFVFYNNLNGRNGAVVHQGDNRTGDGEGDDEVIKIDFGRMPEEIQKIAVCATIHEAQQRRQNFGMVSNAYVRLVRLDNMDAANGEEVLRFDLGEDFSIETAIVVAEFYRHNGVWKFSAVAAGYQNGLSEIVRHYGGNV